MSTVLQKSPALHIEPSQSLQKHRRTRLISAAVVAAFCFAGAFLLYYHIAEVSRAGLGQYEQRVKMLGEYTDWEDVDATINFLHHVGFTERQIKELLDYRPYGESRAVALMRAATKQQNHLEQLISSRATARHILYFFCGFQLLLGYLAIVYSIWTGRMCGAHQGECALPGRSQFLKNMHAHIAGHSSSLITILGICGTFFGLTRGLSGITDTPAGRIDLQPLFISLSIAFISSLSGIVISFITRIIQQAFKGEPRQISTLVNSLDALRQTNKTCLERNTQAMHGLAAIREDIAKDVQSILDKAVRESVDEHRVKMEAYAETIGRFSKVLIKHAETAETEVAALDAIREQHMEAMRMLKKNSEYFEQYLEHMSTVSKMVKSSKAPVKKITSELVRFQSALDRSIGANEYFVDKFMRRMKQLDARYGATSYVTVAFETKEDLERFKREIERIAGKAT